MAFTHDASDASCCCAGHIAENGSPQSWTTPPTPRPSSSLPPTTAVSLCEGDAKIPHAGVDRRLRPRQAARASRSAGGRLPARGSVHAVRAGHHRGRAGRSHHAALRQRWAPRLGWRSPAAACARETRLRPAARVPEIKAFPSRMGGRARVGLRRGLERGDNYFVDIYLHLDFAPEDVAWWTAKAVAFQLAT